MKIIRNNELVQYNPKGHYNMLARRAHSEQVSGAKQLTIGLSVFQSGGGAENSVVPEGMELVYYIVDGEIELTTPDGTTVLKTGDSALFQTGDTRAVKNMTDREASMLVIAAKLPTQS